VSNKKSKSEKTPAYSIDDFTEIEPLATGYELQPGKFYLILTPKQFNRNTLNALFDKLRDSGVEFGVHIGETTAAKHIRVLEANHVEGATSNDSAAVAAGTPTDPDRSEGGAKSVEADEGPIQRPLGY
jgi:hypothetical protein